MTSAEGLARVTGKLLFGFELLLLSQDSMLPSSQKKRRCFFLPLARYIVISLPSAVDIAGAARQAQQLQAGAQA